MISRWTWTLGKKQVTSGAIISYMIYPNENQIDKTLDKKQATSGAIISYERALWLEQGTGYVVDVLWGQPIKLIQ